MAESDAAIRVLHVDDEPDFTSLTADVLEQADDRFTVEPVASVETALERLEDGSYDCVISDYDMPGKNGIDFLEAVRSTTPELPFVLFTGKGSEEVASAAISAGVTDYLQKGTGMEQYELLANRVRNAVTQYRAERALEENRRQFQTLVEEATDVTMIVAPDGEIKFATPAAGRILGRPREELVGSNGFDYIHPDDRDAVMGTFAELIEDPTARRSAEFRYEQPDGSYVWLEARGRNLLDDEAIDGIVVYARDTTERKEREIYLQRIERRYRAIFNDPNILVGLLDPDGTVRDVNRTAMAYIESELEEVTGKPFWETPWWDTEDDETVSSVKSWIRRAADGEYVDFEASIVGPDGPRVVSGVIRPVTDDDGEVVSLIISDRDVTESKRRARELARQRSLLKAQQETSIDGILVVDEEGSVASYNERFTELWGIPQDLLEAGSDEQLLEWVAERRLADPASFLADVRYLYEHPDEVSRDRIDLADGRVFDRYAAPVRDENGTHYGRVWFFRDITEQQRREEELRRQNERLEAFASIVSHDLRGPMNVAEGRLELAREECDSSHLDEIERAHERMDDLIDDLLTFARTGEAVGDPRPMPLRDVAEEAWNAVATSSATLHLESTPEVVADPDALRRVFENLFRNAIEHGGPDVTVTVATTDRGFVVADDGPGVPSAERERVFEAGYSNSEEGTGFGLAIVEQLVDAHGWTITIGEGDAGGARFEVTGVDFEGS